jgi:hypothetical protein
MSHPIIELSTALSQITVIVATIERLLEIFNIDRDRVVAV